MTQPAPEAAGQPKRMILYVDETMHTPNGYVPAAVTEGEAGFAPMIGNGEHAEPWYWGHDLEVAKRLAAEHNTRRGLTEQEVAEVLFSSLRAQFAKDAGRQRWEAIKDGRPAPAERWQP